jgi:signal transduction histidine kinase
MAPLAQARGVTLVVEAAGESIQADAVRLRQVLLILLDNRPRYTPAGGEIRIERPRQGRQVILRVADTGAGIPAEHVPHVFERFYQIPRIDEPEGKNNGLGLSIAKGLVEAMGGKIKLESQEGRGTVVELMF